MTGVVRETEKAGQTRQVSAGETNASEPLMKCRKRREVIETGLQSLARDEARGKPADCPSGDRHEGGVNPVQALVRNVVSTRTECEGLSAVFDRDLRGKVKVPPQGA